MQPRLHPGAGSNSGDDRRRPCQAEYEPQEIQELPCPIRRSHQPRTVMVALTPAQAHRVLRAWADEL